MLWALDGRCCLDRQNIIKAIPQQPLIEADRLQVFAPGYRVWTTSPPVGYLTAAEKAGDSGLRGLLSAQASFGGNVSLRMASLRLVGLGVSTGTQRF